MMSFKTVSRGISVLALLGGIACQGELGRPVYPSYTETIVQLAEKEPDLSKFLELADKAGLKLALSGSQATFTVFAPTNAAYSAFPGLAALESDPAALSALLRYGMLPGHLSAAALHAGGDFQTITSTTVHIEAEGETITAADSHGTKANVTKPNIFAKNGVIHVVDKVLQPPTEVVPGPGDLVEELGEAGFATMIAVSTETGLSMTMMMAGPYTVFAPNDAAFTTFGDLSSVDDAVIQNIMLNHVVTGSNDAAALMADPTLESLAGIPLAVSMMGAQVGGAAVGEQHIAASNGVAHELTAVIKPPTAVEYIAASDNMLTRTNTAITRAAGMVAELTPDTLAGDAPVTVFAPNGMAWMAAGIDPMTADPAELAAILKRHTVVGQVLVGDLTTNGEELMTLNGTVAVDLGTAGEVALVDGAGNRVVIVTADSDNRLLTGAVHVVSGDVLTNN